MSADATTAAFRYGYGLPLAPGAPVTPDALLAALAEPDAMAERFPIMSFARSFADISEVAQNKKAAETDPALLKRLDELRTGLDRQGYRAIRATIARAVDATDSFRERLMAFWADHFTISNGREQALLPHSFAEDCLRPNLAGRFGEMLAAVVHHPGMLIYLDQTRSAGPNSRSVRKGGKGGLNENLARELMELHTMGVGAGYSQTDVRALATLLAGLTYGDRQGYRFDARLVEPGPKTVLGKSYDGKGEAPIRAFLADLAVHPDTARHISRKLVVHFLSDTPDPGMVDAMAAEWLQSGGELARVYGAMLRHPAAFAGPAAKVRQPFDFLIAALRGIGVTGTGVMGWPRERLLAVALLPLRAMGQAWKMPLGPDGWPEEIEAWITPQGLAERIAWAMRWPAELGPLPDPKTLAETALADRASAATLWSVVRAESLAEGVGLVFSSPEFNRR